MIVADASVVVEALLRDGAARAALREGDVHTPHLVDSEVLSTLRRMAAGAQIDEPAAVLSLHALRQFGLLRHAVFGFSDRIWELRHNVTTYDAAYVALAEAIECPLLTTDARLTRAPGLRCPVTLVPD